MLIMLFTGISVRASMKLIWNDIILNEKGSVIKITKEDGRHIFKPISERVYILLRNLRIIGGYEETESIARKKIRDFRRDIETINLKTGITTVKLNILKKWHYNLLKKAHMMCIANKNFKDPSFIIGEPVLNNEIACIIYELYDEATNENKAIIKQESSFKKELTKIEPQKDFDT